MFIVLTGLKGGGKSLSAVDLMVWCLARGHACTSNIELLPEGVTAIIGHERWKSRYFYYPVLAGTDPYSFPRGDPRGTPKQRKSFIFIDEAAQWLSSYDSTGGDLFKLFTSWAREEDKLGQVVYLIVQDPSLLAKRFRVLVQNWIFCEKMSSWRRFGFIRAPWPYSRMIRQDIYDLTCTNRENRAYIWNDPRLWKCYRTDALFGDAFRLATAGGGQNAYDVEMPEEGDDMDGNDRKLLRLSGIAAAVGMVMSMLCMVAVLRMSARAPESRAGSDLTVSNLAYLVRGVVSNAVVAVRAQGEMPSRIPAAEKGAVVEGVKYAALPAGFGLAQLEGRTCVILDGKPVPIGGNAGVGQLVACNDLGMVVKGYDGQVYVYAPAAMLAGVVSKAEQNRGRNESTPVPPVPADKPPKLNFGKAVGL